MTLTVPTAGVIGGASASIQVARPDTFGQISEFGQKMADLGRQRIAEKQNTDIRRAQLGMTQDMAMGRLEVEQLPPDQIGGAWEAKKAEILGKYVPHDAAGNPTGDAKVSDELGLAFSDLSGKHDFALAEKVVNLSASQRRADWLALSNDLTTAAVTADPETFGALVDLAGQEIDARVARGDLDPASGEAEKQKFRNDVYSGRAASMIDNDPQGFLGEADGGKWDALGGEGLSKARQMATREVDRRQTEAEKADALIVKQRNDALKSSLGEMKDIFKTGQSAADEALLSSPAMVEAAKADPEVGAAYAEAMAAKSLRDETPGLRMMTPDQLTAAIDAEKANPKAHLYQTERLKVLEGWRDEAAKRWTTDRVNVARDAGLPVPDLPAFDPADPKGFATGLARRRSFDAALTAQGYGPGQGIFSAEDIAALKPVLDPKAPAEAKLVLADAILAGTGNKPEQITGLLGADPVFGQAIKLMATGGDQNTAAQMLRGQQKIALGTVAMPSEKTMSLLFDDVTGGFFAQNPQAGADTMAAARAIYADEATGVDPDGAPGGVSVLGVGWSTDPEAITKYTRAVQRASGAEADANGNLTIGGLQTFRDHPLSLPAGVPLQGVEDAWDRVDAHLRGWRPGADPLTEVTGQANPPPLDPMRVFRAASIDGKSVPDFGGDAQTMWDKATPVRVGNSDYYELMITIDGRSYKAANSNDSVRPAYRFRLSDLIREASKP